MGPDPHYILPPEDDARRKAREIMYANTKPVMDAEAARIEAEIKTFMLMGFTLAELAVFAPDWNCPCRLCKGGTQVVVKSMVQ